MNEKYLCRIQTPIGEIKGNLILKSEDNNLSGKIESMGINTVFSNGKINGNNCEFSGLINSLMGSIKYTASGVLNENSIRIIAKTDKGIFQINGEKEE